MTHLYPAEIMAGAGFDWLLIDNERAPNQLQSAPAQLQAVAPYASHPIVRPAWNDPVKIKRLIDIGTQTLFVPMVQGADETRATVEAMRYPPNGIHGIDGVLARALRWNHVGDYLHQADAQMCTLIQAETTKSLEHLNAMLTMDGVDGVFIGPGDLAVSMRHPGAPGHPEVRETIDGAIQRIVTSGEATGVLSADQAQAEYYPSPGTTFVAVGTDVTLLARSAEQLAKAFKGDDATDPQPVAGVYWQALLVADKAAHERVRFRDLDRLINGYVEYIEPRTA